MKKYYGSSFRTRTSVYAGAVATCAGCVMKVIKFRYAERPAPTYAILEGQDDIGHYVLTLVDGTTCRLLPAEITVIWIRDFAG